jgi:hypothetical protein
MLLKLYAETPPERVTILGKGPSLDVWHAERDSFLPSTIFACNEAIHVAPTGSYWVTGEGAFAREPGPDGCIALKQWPGNAFGDEETWKYSDFRFTVRRFGVGAVALAILGEWLENWGEHCHVLMAGFDAWSLPQWWDATEPDARPMYAACLRPEWLAADPREYTGGRRARQYNYTWANASIVNAIKQYGHRFQTLTWLHQKV